MSSEQFALPQVALTTTSWSVLSTVKIHWDTDAGKSAPNLT